MFVVPRALSSEEPPAKSTGNLLREGVSVGRRGTLGHDPAERRRFRQAPGHGEQAVQARIARAAGHHGAELRVQRVARRELALHVLRHGSGPGPRGLAAAASQLLAQPMYKKQPVRVARYGYRWYCIGLGKRTKQHDNTTGFSELAAAPGVDVTPGLD